MSAPAEGGGGGGGGPPPSGSTGFDEYGTCNLGIELRYHPSKTGMYAVICRYVGGVLYMLSITENAWFSDAVFGSTKVYTDAVISLTENSDIPGNYTGSVPAFSVGDAVNYTSGAFFIEYWTSTGGTPDRLTDTCVGVQPGYFDDLTCTWYSDRDEFDIRTHTVNVQQGDDSNTNIHTDQRSCCERIADMEALLRHVFNRVNLLRAGK